MAYANYPQNIFDRIKALILVEYSTIHIVNKRIINEEGIVDSDSLGKYQKALGLWLFNDLFTSEGAPQVDDRVYEFQAQLVVKDVDEDQNLIWDMAERIKYTCETNKGDSENNWYRCEVSSIEYALPDVIEPNLKKVTLTMRFQVHVVND